jgi:hypothetical protein
MMTNCILWSRALTLQHLNGHLPGLPRGLGSPLCIPLSLNRDGRGHRGGRSSWTHRHLPGGLALREILDNLAEVARAFFN